MLRSRKRLIPAIVGRRAACRRVVAHAAFFFASISFGACVRPVVHRVTPVVTGTYQRNDGTPFANARVATTAQRRDSTCAQGVAPAPPIRLARFSWTRRPCDAGFGASPGTTTCDRGPCFSPPRRTRIGSAWVNPTPHSGGWTSPARVTVNMIGSPAWNGCGRAARNPFVTTAGAMVE